MIRPRVPLFAFLIVNALLGVLALAGTAQVPFHPDESTFLYLSADFERLFSDPASMAWQPDRINDVLQRYRTLDAPLGRYLVGFGRWLAGLPALPVDWNWGGTWQQNQQAGALPDANLLLAGRYALAALLPFSSLLMYLSGRRVGGEFVGWTAALLFISNALVLMLARRAISEGALVFTTVWTLFCLVQVRPRPWLTGIAAGLAFCAKHSLGALAPVGLLAILWQPGIKIRTRLLQSLAYLALYGCVVAALNPFLWTHPIAALQNAGENRRVLASAQTADRPEQTLDTPGKRLIGLLGALYLTPPLPAETGNYLKDTQVQDTAYLANPFNRLLRSLPAGGLLLVLTVFGGLAILLRVTHLPPGKAPHLEHRRELTLLLLATGLQTIALLVLVPLPFQRYYLPLTPYVCLWAAFGIQQAGAPFLKAIRDRNARPRMA